VSKVVLSLENGLVWAYTTGYMNLYQPADHYGWLPVGLRTLPPLRDQL